MTAQPKPTAADVLARHAGWSATTESGQWITVCADCGVEVTRHRDPLVRDAAHAQHQADMLAAAGLLATAEHDARVAARALRGWIAEWPTTPGDGTFLADVAGDGRARADRIAGGGS